jgi:hypothetical protein
LQVLSVIDVNEAPVVFDQSYALDVATPIRVSLAAFDPDSGFKPQFSKLNFSVLESNDTNGYFLLDPVSGVFTGPPLNLDLDPTKNAFYFKVCHAQLCVACTTVCAWFAGSLVHGEYYVGFSVNA